MLLLSPLGGRNALHTIEDVFKHLAAEFSSFDIYSSFAILNSSFPTHHQPGTTSRRHFRFALARCRPAPVLRAAGTKKGGCKISVARWSLHKGMFAGWDEDRLPDRKIARPRHRWRVCRTRCSSTTRADAPHLAEMKKPGRGEGVTGLLIMCDRGATLGDPDEAKRTKAVENHYKWLDARCHARLPQHPRECRQRPQKAELGRADEAGCRWPASCLRRR